MYLFSPRSRPSATIGGDGANRSLLRELLAVSPLLGPGGGGVIMWITCDRCRERLAGREQGVAGAQPAVCLQCREPFEATRQQQKFCSASCRARSWREVAPGALR